MILLAIYALFAFIAGGNYFLMRRPMPVSERKLKFVVLIPARDEELNLRVLLPQICPQAEVIVFDDESEDGTALVASEFGASVLSPSEPLPKGWTGKNRACHELGLAAAKTDADWWIFLDADVQVSPRFAQVIESSILDIPNSVGVITGFPEIAPGEFPEPIFLGWVGWILLATNPFGLVSRTRKGHNMFTNGQITVWRPEVWQSILPNETMKSAVLEDVKIGRLLAKRGIGVEVVNLSDDMIVQMYETWQEALDGMSKNSFEIIGSIIGSVLLSIGLLFVSWAWIFTPNFYGYFLFVLSGLFAASTCKHRRSYNFSLHQVAIAMPLVTTIGAYTILRSTIWKLTGKTAWKGRFYP
jgi:cellulose synthase/poly-beta-1,6-N-acetylglucosamine synthase-like glycosyltransferase